MTHGTGVHVLGRCNITQIVKMQYSKRGWRKDYKETGINNGSK